MKIIRVECFHCGLPVPTDAMCESLLEGVARKFCCAGCEAAAATIVALGLSVYYRQREEPAGKPDDSTLSALDAYDDALLVGDAVVHEPDGRHAARLVLEGMACAACGWLIEQRLQQLVGISHVAVDQAKRQAYVRWDPGQVRLGEILRSVWRLGYRAWPFEARHAHALQAKERAALLRRLGVASLCGMQVMMVASALWFDAGDDGLDGYLGFLNAINFIATLPIVGYAAVPFYRGALRDLRNRSAGIDVPVALGILLAFLGSSWNLHFGGEVYFDSVAMFVTLLLVARYLEAGGALRAEAQRDRMHAVRATLVTRLVGKREARRQETVPANALALGDRLRVVPGEALAVDGVVRDGRSAVDESILTGESRPVAKAAGDRVVAGSVNLDSSLEVEVTALRGQSFIARIAALVDEAAIARPAMALRMNRVAVRFTFATLAVAAFSIVWHAGWRGDAWLPSTVAVLVVSCPCALALAMPAAMTSASSGLLAGGVALLNGQALERLADVTLVIFDKTGTLTYGRPQLVQVHPGKGVAQATALGLAARLAQGSEHPLARALLAAQGEAQGRPAEDLRNVPGRGLSGTLDGVPCMLGSRAFLEEAGIPLPALQPNDGQEAWFAHASRFTARFQFEDALREDAQPVLQALRAQGLELAILSGDRPAEVHRVAQALGLAEARGGLLPHDKLAVLAMHQARGEVVMVVGDGVNDAPMFARADVAVAVAGATAQAQLAADLVLLRAPLAGLAAAHRMARATRRVMHQNLGWALGYNLVALPMAITGWVAPWIAALCMSTSSLLVTLNALRLRRVP